MSSRHVGDWIVLVATRDRSHLLAGCLDGLVRQHLRPREIVIIDQSSNNRTEKVCRDYPVRYLKSSLPGKSPALNLGLQETASRYVAITDDDCIPNQEWLVQIAEPFRWPDTRIVTGRVVAGDLEPGAVRSRLHDTLTQKRVFRKRLVAPTFIMSGCNFAFDRELLARIGGFDEDFGPGGRFRSSDDNEWSYRALRAGYEILYQPTAVVVHRSWRSAREDLELMDSYGFAVGAFFARMRMTSLVDFAWHSIKLASWLARSHLLNLRHRDERAPYIQYWRGFLDGWREHQELRGALRPK